MTADKDIRDLLVEYIVCETEKYSFNNALINLIGLSLTHIIYLEECIIALEERVNRLQPGVTATNASETASAE